jgi:uncharacterized protein (UPF0335 family)
MYNRQGITGMSSLQKTIEKIKKLETEKQGLLLEINELKKMADAKASALETELASLREDVKTLKTLMGVGPPSAKPT